MVILFTKTGTQEAEQIWYREMKSPTLSFVTLRCLTDLLVEMQSRWLGGGVWGSGERCKLKVCVWEYWHLNDV